MNRIMKRITVVAAALGSAAFLANAAHAASTITVNNKLTEDITVAVYSGGDVNCDWEAENEKPVITAGTSQSFTCKGRGRDRCKLTVKVSGNSVCNAFHNTCAGAAMTVEDGYKVHLSPDGSGGVACAYEAPTKPDPK